MLGKWFDRNIQPRLNHINEVEGKKIKHIVVYQHGVGHYLKVNVNGKEVQTVNPRSRNWPTNLGAFPMMDSFDNLPEGFIEK